MRNILTNCHVDFDKNFSVGIAPDFTIVCKDTSKAYNGMKLFNEDEVKETPLLYTAAKILRFRFNVFNEENEKKSKSKAFSSPVALKKHDNSSLPDIGSLSIFSKKK